MKARQKIEVCVMLLMVMLIFGLFGYLNRQIKHNQNDFNRLETITADFKKQLRAYGILSDGYSVSFIANVWVKTDERIDVKELKSDFDLLVDTLGYEKKYYPKRKTFEQKPGFTFGRFDNAPDHVLIR